jgi:hypothetical protein
MIYLFISLIIISLSYIEAGGAPRKFSMVSLAFIMITLVLLAGLRKNVGPDWGSYITFYQNVETSERLELGYALLNNIFSNLSIPYNFFLLFVNGFSLSLMYVFLRKNTHLVIIGALLFFSDLYLYFNLSGIRQAIAISITCYSITYVLNRQFGKFLLTILIASSSHMTAFIFIFAYFLPKKILGFRHLFVFFILVAVGGYYLQSISKLITLYTIKDATFYSEYQVKPADLLELYSVGIIKRVVLLGVILAFGKRIFDDSISCLFFNIYLCGLAIYIATYMISPDIGVRLSSYFTIFDIVLVGRIIYVTKQKLNRMVIVTIFVGIALYKLYGYIGDESYNYHTALFAF